MSDEQSTSTAERSAERSPTEILEALIAQCWSEVLGIASPNKHDDFFELGGDSMQGMELTDRVGQRLPFEAPLVALFFQDPTISGFASAIAAEASAEDLARLGDGAGTAAEA
ncbi:MAG TPA: phosphopantetheine-binding protein [Kofleriaceae bacterium]|nr:phosphopantetheine-binding protein [Kofleriaceae bacterium]